MQPSRNQPCPCGSGKKYKRCCFLEAGNQNTFGQIEPMADSSRPPRRSSNLNISNLIDCSTKELKQQIPQNFERLYKLLCHNMDDMDFHLYNNLKENGAYVLVIESSHYSSWDIDGGVAILANGDLAISGTGPAQGRSIGLIFLYLILHSNTLSHFDNIQRSIFQSFRRLLLSRSENLDQGIHLETVILAEAKAKDSWSPYDQPKPPSIYKKSPFAANLPRKTYEPDTFNGHFINIFKNDGLNRMIDGLLHHRGYSYGGDPLKGIQFVFSDKTVLTLFELLIHPYYQYLPDAIRIDKKFQSNCELTQTLSESVLSNSDSMAIESMEPKARAIAWLEGLLEQVILQSSKAGYKVYFTNSIFSSARRRGFEISGIDDGHFDSVIRLNSVMENEPPDEIDEDGMYTYYGEMQTLPHESRFEEENKTTPGFFNGKLSIEAFPCKLKGDVHATLPLTSTLTYNPNSKSISGNQLEYVTDSIKTINPFTQVKELNEHGAISADVYGHKKIQKMILGFENIVKENPTIKVENCIRSIDASHLKLITEINLSRTDKERLAFSFSLDEMNYPKLRIDGLPPEAEVVLKGLKFGMGSCFDYKNTNLAVQAQGPARQNDLKLLRHRGMSALIFCETLEYLKANEILSDKSEKIFLKQLHQKLGLICSSKLIEIKEHKNPPNITQFASTKVIKLIKLYVKLITALPMYKSTIFYLDDSSISVNLYNPVLNCLSMIVERFISHQPTKVFTKSSQIQEFTFNFRNITSLYCSLQGDNLHTNSQKMNFSYSNAFPDAFSAFGTDSDYYVDGKKVESLSELELQSEIELNTLDNGSIDWFDLNPRIFFKGKEVASEDAIKMNQSIKKGGFIEYRGQFYLVKKKNIPSLMWLDYFWEKLADKSRSKKKSATKLDERIENQPPSEVLNMLALRKAGVPVIGGEEWANICQVFDRLGTEPTQGPLLSKEDFKTELKDFQKIGVQWMLDLYALKLGGILADDMGLGKTVQALAFLVRLHNQKKLGKVLIVLPTSLVYNWQSELQKFAPQLPFCVFDSKQRDESAQLLENNSGMIVFCTYGLLVRNIPFFEGINWNVNIFDEAQNLKNITAQRTSIARKIKARSKFSLTGTPMENHFGEFYSLIDLSVSGALGLYSEFMRTYGRRGNDSQPLSQKDITFLKMKTRPLVMRRTKKAILSELPDKQESVINLSFEKEQEKIYRNIAIMWNKKVMNLISNKGEAKSQFEMLTALLRLRQICSCPQLVPNVSYKKISPKLELLKDALVDLVAKNENVLVFTNFSSTLKIFKDHLTESGVNCLALTGDLSVKKRTEVLDKFNRSETPHVLFLTLKVGGVGLNLTKASYVFHIEPWWNPAVENQATDRVHRMGQKRSVHVYRYIMNDSVEGNIQKLKLKKAKSFDLLFKESESEKESLNNSDTVNFKSGGLSKKDFEVLLGE